jgi:hypothetical protein
VNQLVEGDGLNRIRGEDGEEDIIDRKSIATGRKKISAV